MKRVITLCLVVFLMSVYCLAIYAQQVTVAFIGDKGTFLDNNKAANEWAQKTYKSPLIAPGDISKTDLTKYAVVWWHDGDTDPTAQIKDCKDALNNYIQSGGTLLLSAAAEKLATDLGIESGVPRVYGPGADAQKAGLTIPKDTVDHPVWEGFERAEGKQIELTTVGFPKSSDYWSLTYKDAVTIGNCWETGTDWTNQVGAFVEWSNKNTGKGLVFGIGWRLPHWTADNKDRATLEKMTTNVINYLGSKSTYMAVNPSGSLVTTWGEVKQR
ncbi:MAG: hypothetical protein QG641_2625 [Candidatus Poribacteria bacterium]|nr:hypothetical protein [Candidatus Poribacteria bacterium]